MYFGKYRGIVKDTQDPEKRGRVKVSCPEVLGGQTSKWALPCLPPNYFAVPPVGSWVWVEFEGGRKDSPIWTGCWYPQEQWARMTATGFDTKCTRIINKVILDDIYTFNINARNVNGNVNVLNNFSLRAKYSATLDGKALATQEWHYANDMDT